jgi:hypothetical protein
MANQVEAPTESHGFHLSAHSAKQRWRKIQAPYRQNETMTRDPCRNGPADKK